jgi:hypothetical protein
VPLSATSGAIGAVSQLLRDHLMAHIPTLGDVTVGRPQAAAGGANLRFNLFLYEVQFDAYLKNIALEEDGPPPLWLSLRYLLTPFDSSGDSDTIEAHGLLGAGVRSLQAVNFRPQPGVVVPELDDSPDMLKLTFEEASVELLSRIMQGSDEQYRCSVGFHVRPVMIAPPEPPRAALLVGVDYTAGGVPIAPAVAVQVPVIPSLGPRLESMSPATFEAGDTLVIRGADLIAPDVSIEFHGAALTVVERRPDRVEVTAPALLNNGQLTSAGSWPVVAVRVLPGGKRRSSNPLLAGLRPILSSATPGANVLDPVTNILYRTIDLGGRLLGADSDDVVVALLRNSITYGPFDRFVAPAVPPPIDQSQRQLQIPANPALPAGAYRLILRVNGEQARNSPLVNL